MSPSRALASLLCLALLGGCSSATSAYRPARVYAHELNVRYDDAFLVFAGNNLVAEGPGFAGLTDQVHCVPDARSHAEAAESWGTAASLFKGFTYGLAGAGLGGLAGLGFKDKNDDAMFALLITGLVLEAGAIALGAMSLGAKAQASGNALDAVNYYNDSVGSLGGSCAPR